MIGLPDPRDSISVSRRPWGSFQQFTHNQPTTVKVISVHSGARLSLQTHEHRAELWQVLDGPIEVTVGGRSWSAQRDEQVWVPQGVAHRMGNATAATGRVLEIGFGEFDEADIVRLEDDYQR